MGCYKPFPLTKDLVPRSKRKLGTKKIWVLLLHEVFAFPSGFIFGMVAPLYLQKLDASGAGGSVSFLQDVNRHFAVSQILVDIHRSVIDVLEHFGLLRDFKALPEE